MIENHLLHENRKTAATLNQALQPTRSLYNFTFLRTCCVTLRLHYNVVQMAADFQQQMQVLAQALERSLQIQEANAAAHAALIQTLQTSSTSTTTSGEKRRDIKPLPLHYNYSAAIKLL